MNRLQEAIGLGLVLGVLHGAAAGASQWSRTLPRANDDYTETIKLLQKPSIRWIIIQI